MGRPMAITDPNAASRTIIATRKPMPSCPPNSGCTASDGRSPPSSICTAPVRSAVAAAASNRSKAGSRMSSEGTSYCTST